MCCVVSNFYGYRKCEDANVARVGEMRSWSYTPMLFVVYVLKAFRNNSTAVLWLTNRDHFPPGNLPTYIFASFKLNLSDDDMIVKRNVFVT